MKRVVERQVIVTWHKPEEQMPEECVIVPVTFSGRLSRTVTCDHALMIGWWMDKEGWYIEGLQGYMVANGTVHAWADLEPYGGE